MKGHNVEGYEGRGGGVTLLAFTVGKVAMLRVMRGGGLRC